MSQSVILEKGEIPHLHGDANVTHANTRLARKKKESRFPKATQYRDRIFAGLYLATGIAYFAISIIGFNMLAKMNIAGYTGISKLLWASFGVFATAIGSELLWASFGVFATAIVLGACFARLYTKLILR